MAANDAEEQLRQLTQRYRQQLPEKLAQIGALWKESQNDDKGASWDTLYRQLHSLAGTSGTMGLADISQLAAVAEALLLDAGDCGAADDEKKAEITKALQALDAAVAEAARG